MKSTESKPSYSPLPQTRQGSRSFFQSTGEGSFLSKEPPQQDFFFTPKTIQRKSDEEGSSVPGDSLLQAPGNVLQFTLPLHHPLLHTCIAERYAQELEATELTTQIQLARSWLPEVTDASMRQSLIGNIKVLENEARSRTLTAGVNPILEDAGNATDQAARREAALRLAEYARANITRTADVDNYLGGGDSDEAKMATLGQLAAEHGRLEFLLGWIYEGGLSDLSNTGQQRGWENADANRGAFPTHYQSEMHGVQGGDRWCTTFAGYLYRTIGLSETIVDSQAFRSGYRLRHWATAGQSIGGTQVTETDETVQSGAGGAALIDRTDWAALRRSLNAAPRTAESRLAAVQQFFHPDNDRPEPQPGDILIVGSVNNSFNQGHSHTVMVERYDEATYTITTIEGNAEDSVYSRTIDLKNPTDVSTIVAMTRMGTQHFGNAAPGATTPPVADVDRVARYDLMTPIQTVIARLVQFASDPQRLWICSNDARASVNEWINGPLCAQPQATTGSTH